MAALILPATVATVSPLTIVMDGDPGTQVPALNASTYTPAVGDRVRVEIRPRGLQPFVLAAVS